MTKLENLKWTDIVQNIESNKCILFLGSGIYLNNDNSTLEEDLKKYLDINNVQHQYINVVNEDGFFVFKRPYYRETILKEIIKFYNGSFPKTESVLTKIAEIPFSIIITLSNDNLLAKTFNDLDMSCQVDLFNKKAKSLSQNQNNNENEIENEPLIYNLMGNVEISESVVLTYGDFFDYIQTIFQSNAINKKIIDKIQQADRIIFLGLPYDKWYFQLLLRILAINSDRLKNIEKNALEEFSNDKLKQIYFSEFAIDFIPGNTISFIEKLHSEFSLAGKLRKKAIRVKLPFTNFDDLRKLVGVDKLDEVIELLKNHFDEVQNIDFKNSLFSIQNRLKFFNKRSINGVIYNNDIAVEKALIIESLLTLLKELENEHNKK